MNNDRLLSFGCLALLGYLYGCGAMPVSSPQPSMPFFIPTSEDASRIAVLTHQLDTKALHCQQAGNCERVYFGKALVSLFESREAARGSFLQVISQNPSSPEAASSQKWLQWIGNDDNAMGPSTDIVAEFVRDWMERQVTEHSNDEKVAAAASIQDAYVEQSHTVNTLQKQVRDRDRKIAILRSQLEALKLIDEDNLQRKRPVKAPATLESVGTRP